MANRLYNRQVSPKGYKSGGMTKAKGAGMGTYSSVKDPKVIKNLLKIPLKAKTKEGRVKKMGGGMMKKPMMNGSRTNMKIGGFLKKVGKKVGKAAAGVGAAVLAAKALKKKKPKGKKMDAIDKYFAKKGTTLKTGSAIAAETMAKADRDKKIFRKNLSKVAARGTADEKDYDRFGKRIKRKAGGGALRPVDKEKNPGLAKLPTKVRNKMGFMKKGGKV